MRKELIEQAAANEDTWVVFPASAGVPYRVWQRANTCLVERTTQIEDAFPFYIHELISEKDI